MRFSAANTAAASVSPPARRRAAFSKEAAATMTCRPTTSQPPPPPKKASKQRPPAVSLPAVVHFRLSGEWPVPMVGRKSSAISGRNQGSLCPDSKPVSSVNSNPLSPCFPSLEVCPECISTRPRESALIRLTVRPRNCFSSCLRLYEKRPIHRRTEDQTSPTLPIPAAEASPPAPRVAAQPSPAPRAQPRPRRPPRKGKGAPRPKGSEGEAFLLRLNHLFRGVWCDAHQVPEAQKCGSQLSGLKRRSECWQILWVQYQSIIGLLLRS